MMKSLASLLTRSKSVPPTDDQVRRHRDQRRQRDEWRADVDRLTAITARLRTEYARHKGDFAVGRYEELKTMVKTAVEQLNSTVADNKDHRQTAGGSTSGRGAISSMKTRAESFAVTQDRVRADEKTYSEMSPAQLETDADQMRREVVQLKQDFRLERERLERLTSAYQESKRLNPAQRYAALKDMIKDAISPATDEKTPSNSSAPRQVTMPSTNKAATLKS